MLHLFVLWTELKSQINIESSQGTGQGINERPFLGGSHGLHFLPPGHMPSVSSKSSTKELLHLANNLTFYPL